MVAVVESILNLHLLIVLVFFFTLVTYFPVCWTLFFDPITSKILRSDTDKHF